MKKKGKGRKTKRKVKNWTVNCVSVKPADFHHCKKVQCALQSPALNYEKLLQQTDTTHLVGISNSCLGVSLTLMAQKNILSGKTNTVYSKKIMPFIKYRNVLIQKLMCGDQQVKFIIYSCMSKTNIPDELK